MYLPQDFVVLIKILGRNRCLVDIYGVKHSPIFFVFCSGSIVSYLLRSLTRVMPRASPDKVRFNVPCLSAAGRIYLAIKAGTNARQAPLSSSNK